MENSLFKKQDRISIIRTVIMALVTAGIIVGLYYLYVTKGFDFIDSLNNKAADATNAKKEDYLEAIRAIHAFAWLIPYGVVLFAHKLVYLTSNEERKIVYYREKALLFMFSAVAIFAVLLPVVWFKGPVNEAGDKLFKTTFGWFVHQIIPLSVFFLYNRERAVALAKRRNAGKLVTEKDEYSEDEEITETEETGETEQ